MAENISSMVTFQEFQAAWSKADFIAKAISRHKSGKLYLDAKAADRYMHQRNDGICNFAKMIYTLQGGATKDFTAPDVKIASNFFDCLNTQRCYYSLGNGISFAGATDEGDKIGRAHV